MEKKLLGKKTTNPISFAETLSKHNPINIEANITGNTIPYKDSSKDKDDLYELIYNLDKSSKGLINDKLTKKNNDIPFKFKFLEEMSNKEFITLFKEGINYIQKNWSLNDLSIIKQLLFKLEYANTTNPDKLFFGFLKDKEENKLNNVYKKDFILSLFLHRPLSDIKVNNFNKDDLFKIYYNSKIKEMNLYSDFNSEKAIEFTKDYQIKLDIEDICYDEIKNFTFNKTYFIDKVLSNCMISCYKDLINFLYRKITLNKDIMKNILKNYLDTHKIYFVDMNDGLYGLTLYNGTILINNKFNQKRNLNKSPYIGIIFLTLLHEIAHVSVRLFREESNYFNNTFLAIDKIIDANMIIKLNLQNYIKNRKIIDESGFLFEQLFLWNEFQNSKIKNYKYISHLDCIFIFNFNYNFEYKIFNKSFKINRDINGSYKLPDYLKFSIAKKASCINFYLSQERCINANLRFK